MTFPYAFVLSSVAEVKIVVAHLGFGVSVCVIRSGKSYESHK